MRGRVGAAARPRAACAVDPIDYSGRECPCITGWVCDEATRRCVPADASTTGTDAAAPPMDGGPQRDADELVDAGEVATDAGPPDSGPPDAGPTDAGPPSSRCDTVFAGRLFCDGFESGDTSRWDAEDTGGAGSITVVSDTVYMGERALRVQGDPGSGYAGAWKSVFSPSGETDQWLRAYWYLPAADGFGAEVSSMAASGFTYDIVVAANSTGSNFHTHGWPVNSRVDITRVVPADTWTCIELHVHFDSTAGTIALYFDDELVAEATGRDTTVPSALPVITAGFGWKSTTATNVVYVDEIVADTARIGCD